MKNLLYFLFLLIGSSCFGQEVVERDSKLTPKVKEVYNVLKSDYKTLHGQYAAYIKKQLIAAGKYDHGKKVGSWTFFGPNGKLLQRYDYDKSRLTYEAPDDTLTRFRYLIDKNITDSVRVTKPVKPGGRYYGYLRYLNLFVLPDDLIGINAIIKNITIELLISPGGRLAEYKVTLQQNLYAPIVLRLNVNLLSDEDKMFIPAIYNGEPIASSILINATLSGGRRLSID